MECLNQENEKKNLLRNKQRSTANKPDSLKTQEMQKPAQKEADKKKDEGESSSEMEFECVGCGS